MNPVSKTGNLRSLDDLSSGVADNLTRGKKKLALRQRELATG